MKLRLPKIDTEAPVIPVGLNGSEMEVPENANEVGWFTEAAFPGQVGAAILSAHYDTPSGRPAVFYNLEELEVDDKIVVESENGEELTFIINEKLSIPYDNYPVDLIFGDYETPKVILITCSGVWDPIEQTYLNRLVILADLWEPTES